MEIAIPLIVPIEKTTETVSVINLINKLIQKTWLILIVVMIQNLFLFYLKISTISTSMHFIAEMMLFMYCT